MRLDNTSFGPGGDRKPDQAGLPLEVPIEEAQVTRDLDPLKGVEAHYAVPLPALDTIIPSMPPQVGLTRHFEHRPELLFSHVCPDVVDASTHVRERRVGDLKVFHIPELFVGTQEVFLGFGTPNMYVTYPDQDGTGYDKFAGKSLYRAPSVIEATRNFVQSGVLINLLNLPPEAAEAIRMAANKHHGTKYRTCVAACCDVLHDAGFTSGSRSLRSHTFPVSLLASILRNGIQFRGQQISFQIIQTSPKSVERYALGIIKAEILTFWRHFQRYIDPQLKKFGIEFKHKTDNGSEKQGSAPPLPTQVEYKSDLQTHASRTARAAIPMRLFWGPHTLFELRQNRVDVNQYLPENLKAFPQENPSLETQLKKAILFSRPVIWGVRKMLCPEFQPVGTRSEADIYDSLRTHTEKRPERYNIVITGDKITISRLRVRHPIVDWVLSKHVLISGYHPDVRFAGELWKDLSGTLFVSRNSGTYRPSDEQLMRATQFVQAVFPNLAIQQAKSDPY